MDSACCNVALVAILSWPTLHIRSGKGSLCTICVASGQSKLSLFLSSQREGGRGTQKAKECGISSVILETRKVYCVLGITQQNLELFFYGKSVACGVSQFPRKYRLSSSLGGCKRSLCPQSSLGAAGARLCGRSGPSDAHLRPE